MSEIKTRITPGPWHPIQYAGYWIIQDEGNYGGLNLLDEQHFPLAKNNARAIAKVPDMIETLIESYHTIKAEVDQWGDRKEQHPMWPLFKQIETTLQGVTEE